MFSKPAHAARPRIGPPSANHGPFTIKPSICGTCYSQGNPALTTLNTWINPLKTTNDDYNSACSQLAVCGLGFRNAICHTLGMRLKLWLVHKHPSHLEMLLKDPVYEKFFSLTT